MRRRTQRKSTVHACVAVDVNTQRDFLEAGGACPVVNQSNVVSSIRRTMAWVKRNQVPLVSAVDCHREREIRSSGLPCHCVDASYGQEKTDFTMLGSYIKIESDNSLTVPTDIFSRRQQVIFRKRTEDFFLNPKADRFLTNLDVREYIVFGLGMEWSVKAIALGLCARHHDVAVVIDSCGYWNRSEAELAVRLMTAKGVRMITLDQLLSRKLPRPIRYPLSPKAQIILRNGFCASAAKVVARSKGRNGRTAGNGHNGKENGGGTNGSVAQPKAGGNGQGNNGKA